MNNFGQPSFLKTTIAIINKNNKLRLSLRKELAVTFTGETTSLAACWCKVPVRCCPWPRSISTPLSMTPSRPTRSSGQRKIRFCRLTNYNPWPLARHLWSGLYIWVTVIYLHNEHDLVSIIILQVGK